MKIAFVSDVHLGNHKVLGGQMSCGMNRRCREALAAFQLALTFAAQEDCEVFVVVGDLFDTDKPLPTLIEAVQLAINACGMRVVLLLGNHEQGSTEHGHHSLSPLWQCATIVEDACSVKFGEVDPVEVCFLPYRSDPTKDWLDAAVARFGRPESRRRILCVHMGVEDSNTDRWLRGARDAVHVEHLDDLLFDGGFAYGIAGHWHEGEVWEGEQSTTVQLGALVPTGFDNPGFDYGRVFIVDGDMRSVDLRVPGPRFEKLVWNGAVFADMRGKYERDDLYLAVQAQPSEVAEASQAVQHAKLDGWIKDAIVVPSVASARRSSVKAALAAREATTLAEAVDAFVSKMALAADVDRAAVRDRVIAYLEADHAH